MTERTFGGFRGVVSAGFCRIIARHPFPYLIIMIRHRAVVAVVLGALLAQAHAAAPDMAGMIARVERFCPAEVGAPVIKPYRGLSEMLAASEKVDASTALRALDVTGYFETAAQRPACLQVLLDNAITGLEYVRADYPADSAGVGLTAGRLAQAWYTKWLMATGAGRSAQLARADAAVRRYLRQDAPTVEPLYQGGRIQVARFLASMAEVAARPADRLILLDRAITTVEGGFVAAQEKSLLLEVARRFYVRKQALLREAGQPTAPLFAQARAAVRPLAKTDGTAAAHLAELDFMADSPAAGRARLEGMARRKVDSALCQCGGVGACQGDLAKRYPAIAQYLDAQGEAGKALLARICRW